MLKIFRDVGLALAGLGVLLAPILLSASAHSADTLPGPIPALVTGVVDGDTIWVKARIWLGQDIAIKVRLKSVDAPEIGNHSRCEAERLKGQEAKALVAALVDGRSVNLYGVRQDNYGGRVDARIETDAGADLGEELLAKGLAVHYRAQKPWCDGQTQ